MTFKDENSSKSVSFGSEQNSEVSLDVDLRQELLAGLVCLQLVNMLHKNALVFKHVALGPQVEAVVPDGKQKEGKL